MSNKNKTFPVWRVLRPVRPWPCAPGVVERMTEFLGAAHQATAKVELAVLAYLLTELAVEIGSLFRGSHPDCAASDRQHGKNALADAGSSTAPAASPSAARPT